MKKWMMATGALAVCAMLPLNSSAEQVSSPMEVRANITAGACTIDPVAPADFGDVLNESIQYIVPFEISVTCTDGLSYEIGIDAGQNSTTFAGFRAVTTGTSSVPYVLVQDDEQTQWGDQGMTNETFPQPTRAAIGNGSPQLFPGGAVLLLNQVLATEEGLHTDTVNVKVEF